MSDVTMVFDAETAKLVNGFLKIEDRQAAMERRSASLARATNRHSKGAVRGARDWRMSLIAVNQAFGLVRQGIQPVAVLMRQMDQYAAKVAGSVDEAAASMGAFAMMQREGTTRERILAASEMGARYGVGPGKSWSTVQALQSKTGTFNKGLAAAEAVFSLVQKAGVSPEGSQKAVSVGMGLGYTPMQSARLAYAGGKASQLTPAELAETAGPALPAFMGVKGKAVTGYGVAAALSGLIQDPGQLATYTRQVGTILQQRTGAVGKVWGRFGFAQPGQAPIRQLEALQKAGITTMGDLQQAGFAKKESLGLAIILADLSSAVKTMRQVAALYAKPGLIGAERKTAERALPELELHRELKTIDARIAKTEAVGRIPQAALRYEMVRARRAQQLIEQGMGWMVGDDRRVGRLGGVVSGLLGITDPFYTYHGIRRRPGAKWSGPPIPPGLLSPEGFTPPEASMTGAVPQTYQSAVPFQPYTQRKFGQKLYFDVEQTVKITPKSHPLSTHNGE